MKKTRNIFFIALLFFHYFAFELCAYGVYENLHYYVNRDNLRYGYNLAKSITTFHVSKAYNWARFGKAHSVDVVMPRGQNTENLALPMVTRDNDGNILAINDGNNIPMLLGGIPYLQEHFEELKSQSGSSSVTIYSFNLDFERRWSNWYWLINQTANLSIVLFPTVDFSAPSLTDLVRLIKGLHERKEPILVQCKRGRGRSATGITAYLMTTSFMAGYQPSVDEIERYLQGIRPQVALNYYHKEVLEELRKELLRRADQPNTIISSLAEAFKDQIAKREAEIKATYSPLWQTQPGT
jgi:protein-tyrosine phosphatase